MSKSLAQQFLTALIGFAVIRLGIERDLAIYIHPSTIWLVFLAGVVLLLIVGITLVVRPGHIHTTPYQLWVVCCVALLLTFGQTVPPSASLAKQRDSGTVPIISRSGVNTTGLTQNFNVLEWLAAWDSDPTQRKYLGAPVVVTGFITLTDGQHYVSRILITCCVIDAQPVRLAVTSESGLPDEGVWVEVRGVMTVKDGKPLVKAQTVTQIEPPEQQYVY